MRFSVCLCLCERIGIYELIMMIWWCFDNSGEVRRIRDPSAAFRKSFLEDFPKTCVLRILISESIQNSLLWYNYDIWMISEETGKIRKISDSSVIFSELPRNFLNLDWKLNLMACISYFGYFKSNETGIVRIGWDLSVPRRSGSWL